MPHKNLVRAALALPLIFAVQGLQATDKAVTEVVREAECIEERLPVIGEQEQVLLEPGGASLAARVDSGATTTSINAQNIEPYEKDGKPWVRFSIPTSGDKATDYNLAVVRTAAIKRHGAKPIERPVVKLRLRLGKTDRRVDVSLADRSSFEFPLLLGRNFLSNHFLIDVSRKNLLKTAKTVSRKP